MTERAKDILRTAVGEFIETGLPITSKSLYGNSDFGIKPAMIRRELNALDKMGYLSQVHPSGGRVPTNKAYQFFVGELLEREQSFETLRYASASLMESFIAGSMRRFADELSEHLKLLSIVYEPEDQFLFSGLQDLFKEVEYEQKHDVDTIIRDFERLPVRLNENSAWWRDSQNWPQVFVGSSPITRSRHLAVVVEKIRKGDGEVLLIAIGPCRMDYRKPIDLFRCIENSVFRCE